MDCPPCVDPLPFTHQCVSLVQNPSLNFKEVTYELDHPGFLIRDNKGLHIVVYAVQRGLGMEVFPVDLIYRPWKNAEGQVSEEGDVCLCQRSR